MSLERIRKTLRTVKKRHALMSIGGFLFLTMIFGWLIGINPETGRFEIGVTGENSFAGRSLNFVASNVGVPNLIGDSANDSTELAFADNTDTGSEATLRARQSDRSTRPSTSRSTESTVSRSTAGEERITTSTTPSDSRNTTTSALPTTTSPGTSNSTATTQAPSPTLPYVMPSETGTPFSDEELTPVGSIGELVYVVDTPGADLNRLNIEGCVSVQADNVTIRNSRITCRSARSDFKSAVAISSGVSGTTILRNTIRCLETGTGEAPCTAGIDGSNLRATFNDISGSITGVRALGDNVTATRNYIHSLGDGTDSTTSNGNAFRVGLRTFGGANLRFEGNYLKGNNSAQHAIFIQPEIRASQNDIPNAIVLSNYVVGSWNQGILCRKSNGGDIGCQIRDNLLRSDFPNGLIHVNTNLRTFVGCNRYIAGGLIPNDEIFQDNSACS